MVVLFHKSLPDSSFIITCSVIGHVPKHVMSSPSNDEAGQEALGDGLQHGGGKHVDPQLRPPGNVDE